jgi:hypothetical protein
MAGVARGRPKLISRTLTGTNPRIAIRKAAAEVFDTTWPTLRKLDGMEVRRVRVRSFQRWATRYEEEGEGACRSTAGRPSVKRAQSILDLLILSEHVMSRAECSAVLIRIAVGI